MNRLEHQGIGVLNITLYDLAADILKRRGQHEPFKTAYPEVSGKKWSFGREQAPLESRNIKPWLADETDVDSCLDQLKKVLMKEIDAGKRIQV